MIALPLCVAAAAFIVAVGLPSSDPDMWWHLATGRWMIEHGEVLRTDIFSSTATGRPYEVGEWLGQLAMAAVHGALGWPGLAALRALLVALAAFALARVALRAADGASAAAPAARRAVALALTALALALSSIAWTDRPQLVSIALFPLLLDLLFMARAGSRRALYAVPPLLFVWSDLHGAYALGLVVLAVFALDAVVTRRDTRFALVAALAFAAVLLNPGAIGVLPATAHVATAPRIIVEESPPDVLTPAGALFAAFAVGILAAFLLRGGSILAVLLLVPLLWLAFSAQRHMVWFAFAATPFLATALVGGMEGASRRGREGPDPRQRRRLTPGVAGLLSLAALASVPLTAPTAPDESLYPSDAIAALRSSTGILLNEYDWGGYLIWSVPERPVFVDGRLKPFQPDVLDDHLRVTLLRPRWREVLDHHSVRQALLDPERPLAGALREEGWRVVLERPGYVLLERPE